MRLDELQQVPGGGRASCKLTRFRGEDTIRKMSGRPLSPKTKQPWAQAKASSLLQGVGKRVQAKRNEYATMSSLMEDPATDEEMMVLLLDVSRSMHPYLETVTQAVSSLAQMKMLFHKEDELGVVLFGASDTDNSLNAEMGGYNNVVVSRPILSVEQDLSNTLEHISPGSGDGDYVNALVVGMDMIVRETMEVGQHPDGTKKKKKKRLLLITDGETALKPPLHSSSEAELNHISSIMKQQGATVDVILLRLPKRYKRPSFAVRPSRAATENEKLLRQLAKRMRGKMAVVEDAKSLLTALLQHCHVAGIAFGVLSTEKKKSGGFQEHVTGRRRQVV